MAAPALTLCSCRPAPPALRTLIRPAGAGSRPSPHWHLAAPGLHLPFLLRLHPEMPRLSRAGSVRSATCLAERREPPLPDRETRAHFLRCLPPALPALPSAGLCPNASPQPHPLCAGLHFSEQRETSCPPQVCVLLLCSVGTGPITCRHTPSHPAPRKAQPHTWPGLQSAVGPGSCSTDSDAGSGADSRWRLPRALPRALSAVLFP